MPRMGTLMMRSRSFPMIDSSAMMSAMLSRIDWRTFWRCRSRSPAARAPRSGSGWGNGREMAWRRGAAAGGPEVRDDLLAEALRGRTDDGDLLFDRLEEPFVRLQLLFGVAVLHPR